MAPRFREGAAKQQPTPRDCAALEELQELLQHCECQTLAIFQRLASENESLRAQLGAAKDAAAARANGAVLRPPFPVMPYQPPKCSEDDDDGGDNDDDGVVVDADSGLVRDPLDERVAQLKVSEQTPAMEEERAELEQPRRRCGSKTSLGSRGMSSLPSGDRPLLVRLARSLAFESLMSTCILANCITVGMWAHQLVTGQFGSELVFATDLAEHIFVALFVAELALKAKVYGLRSYVPWNPLTRANFVDAMLVIVTGVGFTWLLPLCALIFGFDSQAGPFKTLTVFRTVRLARLVRVFQRVPMFREAWMLIRGLSDSSRTLFWTCIVIFLVTYVFAIVGLATLCVELQAQRATHHDASEVAVLDELLNLMGGLDRLMATLVQVLLGDSFHSFTREAQRFVWWAWLYFYAYISIAVVVLMNLVTAIIVENAMETSKADHDHVATEKEAKRKREIGMLRKLFASLDTDGGGTLSWAEFKDSFDDPDMKRHWMVLDFQEQDCEELFRLLDDGDGEITTEEFMEALFRMSGAAQSKDVFKLQKALEKVQASLDAMVARQHMQQK